MIKNMIPGVLLVSAVTGLSSSLHADAVQWRVEDGGNDHWYEVMPYGAYATWSAAAADAVARGGHLATLTDQGEDWFVTNLYQSIGDQGSCDTCSSGTAALIGGQLDVFGEWQWVTGEAWDWTNWNSGEPSGGIESVLYLRCPGQWNDGTDELDGGCRYAAIIEWDERPPVQWSVDDGGNDHWYQVIDVEGGFSIEEAEARARALGGYLVSLTSPEEDQWVYATFDAYDRWIGAYQDIRSNEYSEPAGGWRWMSGEPMDYSNWSGVGPDNNDISDAPHEEWAHYCCDGRWNDIYAVDDSGAVSRKQIIVEYTTLPGAAFGACCLDGYCLTSTASDCIANGGAWGGVNSSCTDFDCSVACAADLDGNGSVDGADLSIVLGSWGVCP